MKARHREETALFFATTRRNILTTYRICGNNPEPSLEEGVSEGGGGLFDIVNQESVEPRRLPLGRDDATTPYRPPRRPTSRSVAAPRTMAHAAAGFPGVLFFFSCCLQEKQDRYVRFGTNESRAPGLSTT